PGPVPGRFPRLLALPFVLPEFMRALSPRMAADAQQAGAGEDEAHESPQINLPCLPARAARQAAGVTSQGPVSSPHGGGTGMHQASSGAAPAVVRNARSPRAAKLAAIEERFAKVRHPRDLLRGE